MRKRRSRRRYKLPPEVPNALNAALEQQLLEDFIHGKHDRPPRADHELELLDPDSRGYSDFEALLRGEFDVAAQEAEIATGPLAPKPELVWNRQTGHRKLQTTAHHVQRQEQHGGSSSSTAPADAPATSQAEVLDSLELGPPGVPGQPGAQPKSLSQLVSGEFGPRCRRPDPPEMTAKPCLEFGTYSIDTTADHRRNASQKIIDQCKTVAGMISLANANSVSAAEMTPRRNKLLGVVKNILWDIKCDRMDNEGGRVERFDITRWSLLKYSHEERQLKESVAKSLKTLVKRLKKTQKDGTLDLDRIQRRMDVQGRTANALLQVTTGGHDSEFADRMLGVQLRHRELAAMAALGSYALGRFKLFTNFKKNISSYKDEACALREADSQQKVAFAEDEKDGKADKTKAQRKLEKQALKVKVMEDKLQSLREDEKRATVKAKLDQATSPLEQDDNQNYATDRAADDEIDHQGTDADSQSVDDQPQSRLEKIETKVQKTKSAVQNSTASAANKASLGRMLEFVDNAQENITKIMHDISKAERKRQLILGELREEIDLHSSRHMEIMIQSLEFPWRLLDPEVLPPQKSSSGGPTMEQTQSNGPTPAHSVHVIDAASPTGKALHSACRNMIAISEFDHADHTAFAASLDSDRQTNELVTMRRRRNRMLAMREALKQEKPGGTARAKEALDQLQEEHAETENAVETDTESMNQLRKIAKQTKMFLSDMQREIAHREAEVDQLDESDEASKHFLFELDILMRMLLRFLSEHKPSESPQTVPDAEGEATAKVMEELTAEFANLSRSFSGSQQEQQKLAQQTHGTVDGELPEEASHRPAADQLRSVADFREATDEGGDHALLSELLAELNDRQKHVGALRRELDELQGSTAGTNDIPQHASSNKPATKKQNSAKQDVPTDHVGAAEGIVSKSGIHEGRDWQVTEAMLQDPEVLEAEFEEATRQRTDLETQISDLEVELETLISPNGGSKLGGVVKRANGGKQQVAGEKGLQTEKLAQDWWQEGGRHQSSDEAGGEQQTEGPDGGLGAREAGNSKAKGGKWGLMKVKLGIKADHQQDGLSFSDLSNQKAMYRAALKLEREVKLLKQELQKRTRLFLAMLPKEKAEELRAAGVFSKEKVKEDAVEIEKAQVLQLEHQLGSLKKSQLFWQNRLQNHIEVMQSEPSLSQTIQDVTGTSETKQEQADAKQARTTLDTIRDEHPQHADGTRFSVAAFASTIANQVNAKTTAAAILASQASNNNPIGSIDQLVISGASRSSILTVARNVFAREGRESSSTSEPATSALDRLRAFARVKSGAQPVTFLSQVTGGAAQAGRPAVHSQEMRRFQALLPVWRKVATSVRFTIGEVQREIDALTHQAHSSAIRQTVFEIQRKAKLQTQTCDEQLSLVLSLIPDKRIRFLIVQHLIHLLDMPPSDQKPSLRCLALGHITNEDPLRRNLPKDESDVSKVDKGGMRCLAVASLLGQRLCSLMEKHWNVVGTNQLLQMVADALEQDVQDGVQPEDTSITKHAEAFFQSANMPMRLAAAEAASLGAEVPDSLQDTNDSAKAKRHGGKELLHKGIQSVIEKRKRGSMNQLLKEPEEQTWMEVDSQRLPIIPPRRRKLSAELDGYNGSATSLSSSEEDEQKTQGGRNENQRPSSSNALSPRKNLLGSAAKEAKHAFNRRASAVVGAPSEQYWNDMRELVKSHRAELYEEQMQRRRAEQDSWDEQDDPMGWNTFSSNAQIRALQLRGNGSDATEDAAKPPGLFFDARLFLSNGSSLSPKSPRTLISLLRGDADQDEEYSDEHAQMKAEVRRKLFLHDDFSVKEGKTTGPDGSPKKREGARDKSADTVASEKLAKASKIKQHDKKHDLHDFAIGAVQLSAAEPSQESQHLRLDRPTSAEVRKSERRISALHRFQREPSLQVAHSLEEQEDNLPPADMFVRALLTPTKKQKNNSKKKKKHRVRGRPMSAPMARHQIGKAPPMQGFVVAGATLADGNCDDDGAAVKRSWRQSEAQKELGSQSFLCSSRRHNHSPMSLRSFKSDNDSSSDDDDAYEEFLQEILKIQQLLPGSGVPEPRSGVPEPRSAQSKAHTTGAALAVATDTTACRFSPPEGWHAVLGSSAPQNETQMDKAKRTQRFMSSLAEAPRQQERKQHEQPAQVGEALRQQQQLSPTPSPASEISFVKREVPVTFESTEGRYLVTSPEFSAQPGTVMQPQDKRKKPKLLNLDELSQMSLVDARDRLHDSLMLFNRSRLAGSTSVTPDAWSSADAVAWKPPAPASFMPSLKIPPPPQQHVAVKESLPQAVDSHSPVVTAACTYPQMQQLGAPLSAMPPVLSSPQAPVAGAAGSQALATDGTLQMESCTEMLRGETSIAAGPSEQVSARAKALLQYMEGFDTFALDRLLSSRPGTGVRSQLSTPRTPRRTAQSSRPHLPSLFPQPTTAQTQQVQASVQAEAKASTWRDGHLPKILESSKPERNQPEKSRKHGVGLLGENRQLTSQAADWSEFLEQRLGTHFRSTVPGASMLPTRNRQRSNRAR